MWQTAFTTILLISRVAGGVIGDGAHLVRRNVVDDLIQRYVDDVVEPIEKRQAPQAPTTNLTQWDTDTMNSCIMSLEALNGVATNPSGFSVCYNLPRLDNTTGVFQADLRLFKISEPTGDFANIPAQSVQVSLSYIGATVSAVNMSSIQRRDEDSDATSLISWPRKRQNNAPEPILVQAYAFVGQINADVLSSNRGTNGLQDVLVPTVTLTGTGSNGRVVNTTLSSQEATFVAGVFSTPITPTVSEAEKPIQTLVVTGDNPFVVPGLNILIFPIGGIITGLWAILLLSTIGYGTYGRMQFREAYRRKVARQMKGDIARI